MIPVYLHDVVVNEAQETCLVLLKSDLHLDGSLPISIGPFSALNLADKLDDDREDRYDSQNLIPELLEDTDADIGPIQILRDQKGYYRAEITGNTPDSDTETTYRAELAEALALAAETSTQLEVPPELLQNKELELEDAERNNRHLEKISQLRYELETALRNEDFERADDLEAALNGEVRQLEQSMDLDEDIEDELRRAF